VSTSNNDVSISYETSTGMSATFSPWNGYALRKLGITGGAVDPSTWTFHVSGNLYEVPHIARRGHECGGSINVNCVNKITGQPVSISHVFYIDETGHGGLPVHWNHEIFYSTDGAKWKKLDKTKTEHHVITPVGDWISLSAFDSNGRVESQRVSRTVNTINP